MSCRAPVNNGYDIAQWIHDQLTIDLKNGSSSKVNKSLINFMMIFF